MAEVEKRRLFPHKTLRKLRLHHSTAQEHFKHVASCGRHNGGGRRLTLGEIGTGPLSEGDYRHIVETTSEGIWALDLTGRTTYVNEAMARMLGYSVEEMLGRSLFDFVPEADHALAEMNFAEVVAGLRGQLE